MFKLEVWLSKHCIIFLILITKLNIHVTQTHRATSNALVHPSHTIHHSTIQFLPFHHMPYNFIIYTIVRKLKPYIGSWMHNCSEWCTNCGYTLLFRLMDPTFQQDISKSLSFLVKIWNNSFEFWQLKTWSLYIHIVIWLKE